MSSALAHLASPWAYIVLGGLAGLEAAAFVGLVVPGELALLTAGYLVSIGRIELVPMILVAIAAAVVGDSVGYEVGRHLGARLRASGPGRRIGPNRWEQAEGFLERHGGKAVFLGRFVGVLRALVPGLAGATRMPYRRFLVWNALGGVVWATSMVLLGDLAGRSYERIAHVAGRAGLLLLALVASLAALSVGARLVVRHADPIRAAWSRQLERPRVAALRDRYARQLGFAGRRLDRSRSTGLALTAQLLVLALLGWLVGAITQDVLRRESSSVDRAVTRWFVEHREPWVTAVMRGISVLGSTTVLVPTIVVVGLVLRRTGRSWRPLGRLVVVQAGAVVLYDSTKLLVGRPRPDVGHLVATGSAWSSAFPSGHATEAVAVWVAIATAIPVGASLGRRVAAVAVALGIALLVGVARIYLGLHWMTDVLAGWALGGAWLVVVSVTTSVVGRDSPWARTPKSLKGGALPTS